MSDVYTESIQININSLYASSYNNNSFSDCNFFLNNRLEVPPQHTIYVSVVSANIPYSFYNINSKINVLSYTINSITYSLTITQGNYNAYNLVSFLNANLQTGFTCSYDIITNKIKFIHTTYEFSINSSSTCLSILGISSNLNSISKTIIGDHCLNLQNVQTIYLLTNLNVGNICLCNINRSNVLCSIPVEVAPNSNIIYVNQNNFRNNLYSNIISFINIKLTDQSHNLLDLNGIHWTATLQLDFVDFVN